MHSFSLLETLRLYPAIPILNRICSHDYEIPDSGKTIEKGTAIVISLLGAQRDPKYYPNPDEFMPERFRANQSRNSENGIYCPFGDGPRICIGMRLGKILVKLGLATVMHKYKYELDDNMEKDKLKITPKIFVLTPTNGIELKVKFRK